MTPRTKREYLRELVADNNLWPRPLTDEERAFGFLGWHERGYLPHCDFPGLVQVVGIIGREVTPWVTAGQVTTGKKT